MSTVRAFLVSLALITLARVGQVRWKDNDKFSMVGSRGDLQWFFFIENIPPSPEHTHTLHTLFGETKNLFSEFAQWLIYFCCR